MKIKVDHNDLVDTLRQLEMLKRKVITMMRPTEFEFTMGDRVIAVIDDEKHWLMFTAMDEGNQDGKPYVCRRLDKEGEPTNETLNYQVIRMMTDDELQLLPAMNVEH